MFCQPFTEISESAAETAAQLYSDLTCHRQALLTHLAATQHAGCLYTHSIIQPSLMDHIRRTI